MSPSSNNEYTEELEKQKFSTPRLILEWPQSTACQLYRILGICFTESLTQEHTCKNARNVANHMQITQRIHDNSF